VNDWSKLQPVIEYAASGLNQNVTLKKLAAAMDRSLFHAHRTLRATLGETPKQFTLRLRLDRAAGALVSSRSSILDIALECGFESHEAFCRAFRKRFRIAPGAYRRQLRGALPQAHASFVQKIGPCIGLYHVDQRRKHLESNRESMEYVITKQERSEQAILVVRRTVPRTEIAATIGAELPKVFLHAQQRGISITGYPITRYLETSVGRVTLETGMRISAHKVEWSAGSHEGDILAEKLPGGPTAVTIHSGSYDQLQEAYAALEEWIIASGFCPVGPPWEGYLNDPADHPDPKDWKTEVCWPIAPAGQPR
jgi:AraC-like DNA-binding protein/effector-binding domain-containing protein